MRNNIEETIDVGFFKDSRDLSGKYPGRLARDAEGQMWAIIIGSCDNQFTRGVEDAGDGETWLFSAENGHYVLLGVRGYGLGKITQRSNLLGGYETFVSNRFGVEAVFQVDEHYPLAKANPFPPICGDLMFDAFSLSSSRIALWIGLEDLDHGWPPQRPRRVKHSKLTSTIGELSTSIGGKSDSYGINSQIYDVLRVEFEEPRSLESMFHAACIVHDFVNLTIGDFVPMALTALSPKGHSGKDIRRFNLMSQGWRFGPEKRDVDSMVAPMLSLNDTHGLEGLRALVGWCDGGELNSRILHRMAGPRSGRDVFTEHWRTLNMIHGGRQKERARISKLVDDVGKSVIGKVLPKDANFRCWLDEIVQYRNEVVVHPSGRDTLNSKMAYQGPVFTRQMEFLLKAYVLKRGVGVRLDNDRLRDALRYNVDKGRNDWDWRMTGESYNLY